MSSHEPTSKNTHRRDRPVIPVGFGVPGIGDERWRSWTRPIWVFILAGNSGRPWSELFAWGRENKLRKDMVRQLVAWLECHGKATFDHTSKRWKGTHDARVQAR